MTTERFLQLPPLENGDRLLSRNLLEVCFTLHQDIAQPEHMIIGILE